MMKSSDKIIKIVKSLVNKDLPLVSNLSNLSKILYDFFDDTCWCGFYLCDDKTSSMYLGPFQGPVACMLIPYSKGVCGTSVRTKKAIVVENVHEFKDHIACYSKTNSEIVVPIIKNNQVLGVIDLDSEKYSNYSLEDKEILEEVAEIISELF